MTDYDSISPSRLATYATCPRQYEHDYIKSVSTPDETKFYLYQGRAYHETIATVCDQTSPEDNPDEIFDRAVETFETKWAEHIDPEEYASKAHQEHQRRENRKAIESFFDPVDGIGIEHAHKSVATEKRVECEYDGISLHGYTDNVLREGETLHLVDYKRNVRGVLGAWSGDKLVEHLEEEAHEAGRVKNAFQTAAYIEGIKQSDLFEEGMSVRFSFYGLLHSTDRTGTPNGYEVSVSGKQRETTAAYEEYHETIWKLIEAAYTGIANEAYEPEPFDLLREEACPDCSFKEMCPDYLAAEVSE